MIRTMMIVMMVWIPLNGLALQQGQEKAMPEKEAVTEFLAKDSELGGIRNHDPESMPLSEAIDRYVSALKDIEFPVPSEFEKAFAAHIEAWEAMSVYCGDFEQERGELHAIFDRLALDTNPSHAQFNTLKDKIWETWREVETVAKHYDD